MSLTGWPASPYQVFRGENNFAGNLREASPDIIGQVFKQHHIGQELENVGSDLKILRLIGPMNDGVLVGSHMDIVGARGFFIHRHWF